MARGLIGKLPVVYDPVARRVVVENSAEFVETQIRQKLDELAHGKPLHLILSVDLERLKDKEFILTVWPKLLSVTQLYIQYAKDAFTFSGMSECVFLRNRNFGLPLRFTNETIFDMCMLDEGE